MDSQAFARQARNFTLVQVRSAKVTLRNAVDIAVDASQAGTLDLRTAEIVARAEALLAPLIEREQELFGVESTPPRTSSTPTIMLPESNSDTREKASGKTQITRPRPSTKLPLLEAPRQPTTAEPSSKRLDLPPDASIDQMAENLVRFRRAVQAMTKEEKAALRARIMRELSRRHRQLGPGGFDQKARSKTLQLLGVLGGRKIKAPRISATKKPKKATSTPAPSRRNSKSQTTDQAATPPPLRTVKSYKPSSPYLYPARGRTVSGGLPTLGRGR